MLSEDGCLTRPTWSDLDFDIMPWHDSTIYAYCTDGASFEFAVDMDYICSWIQPDVPYHPISYYLAPATLVFYSATEIRMSLESAANPLKLANVRREDRHPVPNSPFDTWRWVLEGHHGVLTLRAVGYTLYFRQQPIPTQVQQLSSEQREGISFVRGFQVLR